MLTPQQKRLFDFIVAKIDGEGVAPTFTDIQAHLGLKSKSGIHRMLGQLEAKGFIRRVPAKVRAIEVLRRTNAGAELRKLKDQLQFAIAWIEGLPTLSAAQEHDKAAALKALGRDHNVLALTGETPAQASRRIQSEGADYGQRPEVL
jgi:DNA-binding MarR family transcriptional regulator